MDKSDFCGWLILGFTLLGFVFIWVEWYIPAIISFVLAFTMIFVSNYYGKREKREKMEGDSNRIFDWANVDKGDEPIDITKDDVPMNFSCRNKLGSE